MVFFPLVADATSLAFALFVCAVVAGAGVLVTYLLVPAVEPVKTGDVSCAVPFCLLEPLDELAVENDEKESASLLT